MPSIPDPDALRAGTSSSTVSTIRLTRLLSPVGASNTYQSSNSTVIVTWLEVKALRLDCSLMGLISACDGPRIGHI
jgi:hypothetical protein